jgi:hypothetical protein
MPRSAVALALALLGTTARAGDLALLPGSVTLDGPHASQRFLVESREGDNFVGDESSRVSFTTDNPAVAEVSTDGVVTPKGDGTVTLTATVGDRTATAAITVRNATRPEVRSFRNEVVPVLTRAGCNQGACHGAAAGKNGLRLTLRGYGPEVDYDVLTRQALGRRIVKSAPAQSLMLLKPTGAVEHGGGVRFAADSPEYRILSEWIAAGTPPPSADDARVIKVEVLPRAIRSEPGRAQRLLVQATYSDGRVRDVTRWARFDATDVGVARVDDSGQVTVVGPGVGSVSVGFSSLVDLATFTVPYPTAVDPSAFDAAARHNPIDDLNLARLRALNIPPSPPADDATFLRRAYLDATGTLPPVAVVEAFLADPDPEKRSGLVDRLLASPEYVDYWSYKWSDLLLISSKKLPAPALWAFYRHVREAVERNEPWDDFARGIVTARGSTLSNGAANYFVLHRDPIDLTESTSMAFLGLSLTCARCHNHPLEKWTQDQYYGMANLFSRVALKDGAGGPGDVIVSAAAEGDIMHPRRGVVMAPEPLDEEPLPIDARGDRREAFADWLESPANPYFDRALINRVWANFFGRGLIDPEDDLRATNPPSDEALLAWLVEDFRAHGRNVKHLIRTMMTSAAYARSGDPLPQNASDSKFFSHYPPKRLPAEVLLDAIAGVTEVPTPFAPYPLGWRSLQLPDARVESPFLDAFGRPEREKVCSCERSAEPSVAQALQLANGPMLNDKLRSDAGVIARLVKEGRTDAEVIDHLTKSALGRPPTEAERARILPVIAEASAGIDDSEARSKARREAIEDVYWAILTSQEFLFNH